MARFPAKRCLCNDVGVSLLKPIAALRMVELGLRLVWVDEARLVKAHNLRETTVVALQTSIDGRTVGKHIYVVIQMVLRKAKIKLKKSVRTPQKPELTRASCTI